MTYIKGNIKQIIFKSDKGFIVGLFKVIDTDEITTYLNKSIVITGTFLDLKMESTYILYGNLVNHSKYGEQFNISSYETIMPESTNGIISFLSSKLFPGIGVKLATKIVQTLGNNVLDLILDDYHHLLKVPTMTEKKAIKIQTILKNENESYKIILNLQNMGFSINDASKIYKYYKESTMYVIEDNIYNLINDIEGIGFLTVDKIAASREINENDERRIKACIIYIMRELCITNGNTYNDNKDIYLGVTKYLHFTFEIDDFNYYLEKLNDEGKIVIEDDRYYLKDYYDIDIYISKFIIKLLNNKNILDVDLNKYISKIEKEHKIIYSDRQKEAIINSLKQNCSIITGGPGTGKTTIIKAIVNLYKKIYNLSSIDINNDIALLAPTGRAAKRLMETTNMNAMTIHKFLKWNKETNDFGINEKNKADCKFVIIDEVSMIDHFLLYHLFAGLKSNIKIIFVGDHHQLPSVGPGNILKDLIDSNIIPTIELNELYRQKEESYIITLAHEIKKGIMPPLFDIKHDDYKFIEAKHNDIQNHIIKICENALDKNVSIKDIQVLIPMYKGINGIDNINNVLQNIFNPHDDKKKEFIHNNITYRVGDKILQIKNNNDLNISNGDIGIINDIIYQDNQYYITINFNDEIVEYSASNFDDIKLGYAISIHKAQGSEFDIVILPMDLAYNRMLYRKLLYTAITRAKKDLLIIGDKEAFKQAIINDKEQIRKTSLAYHLRNE